jgi:cytochrome P450
MSVAVNELYWDPFDIEIDSNPYDIWRRLRDEAPLYRNDRYDFWAVSRFGDVQAASADPKTFLSSRGTVLELMGSDMADMKIIIFMDPPEHDSLRALVSRAFTPRRVSALEDKIRGVCNSLLDPLVGSGGFDYVQDFGAQVPSMVISMLLGVPDSERQEVLHQINTTFHLEPGKGMVNDISLGAMMWLSEYIAAKLAERRKHPGEDLFTALVQVDVKEDDGTTRRLTEQEAVAFGNLLIAAGTETVARLLGWASVVLDRHPDQRAELAADTSLLPNAVEELLRYEAPSPVQGRWTSRPIELHGTVIPEDSKVLLITGSAGRDERRYPDPDRFDIHRDMGSHVSFGFGIHFCLGAALARLEGRIALEETLRRFPVWQVDHTRAQRLHTSTVRGWKSVPVTVAGGKPA